MAAWPGIGAKKKSLHAAEQDRADVKARRDVWHEQLKDVTPQQLVFLDESGAKTNMTRLYGRAPRGERVVSKVPHGHWKTTTMLSAIRLDGPCAAVTVDGAVDAEIFGIYIRDILAPQLRPGDVLVLDNLPAHKAPSVREAVEAVGARLFYLPPYSPDYNPIENMWSKVKSYLRSAAARTVEALGQAIDDALATITASDCRGFFRNCGYHAI
jgi:transposase